MKEKKMSFLSSFESKSEGVNDTVEFVVRVAIVTLSAVILVVVLTLAVGLFMPNDVIESAAILEMVNPAFQTIIGAFVGLLGGLSLNANARDKEPEVAPEPEEPAPEEPAPAPVPPLDLTPAMETVEEVAEDDDDDDDDDDMEPWEKYRNDLRYDANGDGVVDENDFPDWRRAGQ
jgi:hypothetical protein